MPKTPTAEQLARPIVKGSVVHYKNGWMAVRAIYKNTVNLGPIYGGKTTLKKVPRGEVFEDGGAQYANFTKSETYMCQ